MELTQEQTQIIDFIKNSNNNIGIEAGAGCGKTSTLLQALKKVPMSKSVKFFAFSNVIAGELKEKVSSSVKVSTIHATGFDVLKKNYKKVSLNENKVASFVSKYIKGKKTKKETGKFIHSASNFLQKHQLSLMDMSDENINKTCNRFSINICPSDFIHLRSIQKELDDYNCNNLGKTIRVDFNDMVVLPIKMNLNFPKFDVVFFDEAQDMGECHKQVLLNSLSQNGRFVAVYDRRQNIFSFAGADTSVLDSLLSNGNATVLPLSYSFRCSKEIVKHSSSVFGNFKAHRDNIEGEVANGSINEIRLNSDAVLCRNTKPLFDVWAYLASKDIVSFIKGKDFGQELVKMLKKYRKENNYTTALSLDSYLQSIEDELRELGSSNPKFNKKYLSEYEKVTIIKKLLQLTPSISSAIKKLTTVFTEKGKGTALMTIHKSKGLEFNRVFVMRNDLIPSKFCETEEDLQEERRLDWVLRTRAKKSLIYITDFVGDVKPEQVKMEKLHKNSHNWL